MPSWQKIGEQGLHQWLRDPGWHRAGSPYMQWTAGVASDNYSGIEAMGSEGGKAVRGGPSIAAWAEMGFLENGLARPRDEATRRSAARRELQQPIGAEIVRQCDHRVRAGHVPGRR